MDVFLMELAELTARFLRRAAGQCLIDSIESIALGSIPATEPLDRRGDKPWKHKRRLRPRV